MIMLALVATVSATSSAVATASAGPLAVLAPLLGALQHPWVAPVGVALLVQGFKSAPMIPTDHKAQVVGWASLLSLAAALLQGWATNDFSGIDPEAFFNTLIAALVGATGAAKLGGHAKTGFAAWFQVK